MADQCFEPLPHLPVTEQAAPIEEKGAFNSSRRRADEGTVLEEPLPKTSPEEDVLLKGVVRPQWARCGKPNCRCASGEQASLHGPYYYRFWREGGRLRKRYVPRKDVEAVRAACRRRQATEHAERERRAADRAEFRRRLDELERLLDLAIELYGRGAPTWP